MNADKRATFERMYEAYRLMVLQLCTGFVKGDPQQADDLCQEVFVNAWKALDTFRGQASLKTWLYRVTVNTCLQHIRKKKHHRETSLQGLEEHLPAAGTPRHEDHQNLYRAIGQLPDLERLIIMMVLDELTYPEIADVIGVSMGNLRVKIHRIKSKLKTILQDERQL